MPAVAAFPIVDFQAERLAVTWFTPQAPACTVARLQTGTLEYGWVQPLAGFPFLLLDIGGCLLQAGLNLLRVPASAVRAWLGDPGAELHLVLLDAGSATTLAERTVPAFSKELRDCLTVQGDQARTVQVADEVFQLLQQAHAPGELLSQATLYRTTCLPPGA